MGQPRVRTGKKLKKKATHCRLYRRAERPRMDGENDQIYLQELEQDPTLFQKLEPELLATTEAKAAGKYHNYYTATTTTTTTTQQTSSQLAKEPVENIKIPTNFRLPISQAIMLDPVMLRKVAKPMNAKKLKTG